MGGTANRPRGIPIRQAPDRPENRYALISHDNLTNRAGLSGLAMALHHYLITRPPEWEVGGADDVASYVFPHDSRESVRRAFRELRNAGFLILHKEHAKDGGWVSWYEPYHEQQPVERRTPSTGQVSARLVQTPETRRAVPPAKTSSFRRSGPDAGKPAAGFSAA